MLRWTWSWNSTSRVGSLWWWSPVLWKHGHLSANVRLLAFFPPSLFSFPPVTFLLILPAQFQRPGYKHIQVKQPLFLLDRKWHGVVICRLRNGGSRRKRLRFSGKKKWRCWGRRCLRWLRRKWRCGRWGEKRGKGIGVRRYRREWAQSVLVIFSRWLLHNLRVVEDWSWEVTWGERERGRGGIAWGRTMLQKRTGTGWVQLRLGALHPAGDLLK